MIKLFMMSTTLFAATFTSFSTLAKTNDGDKAVSMVLSFPKVKEFSHRMAAAKQAVQAVAERKSKCVFNVHVYEDYPGHIATFGFFDADICRGKITEEE
jgi:hypothetical protein